MSCSGTTRRSDSRPNLQLEVVVDAQRSVNAKLLRLVNVATRAASTDSDIAIW